MFPKKNSLFPEIRFPNFTDAWEQRKLGIIAERVTRKNSNLESSLPLTISAQYGLIAQTEFFDKRIASTNMARYYLIYNGEFAYNKSYSNGYPWGAIKRLDAYKCGVLSTLYIIFKPTEVISQFLVSYFDTTCWHTEISNIAVEGARNHGLLNIPVIDFFKISIKLPSSKEEQTQIGNFFKQLDETIALHKRKLAKLFILKSAFLTSIFCTRNIQIYSQNPISWEQRKLLTNIKSIIDFRGRTPKKLGMEWSNKGYLALSALNVKNGYIDPTIDAHFGNDELYEKWMEGNELSQGQVLFTTEAPMGNVAQVPDNKKYILSQRTIAFCVNDTMITDNFLAILLRSPKVFADLEAFSSGGTAKGISQKSLENLIVILPKLLDEQTKIGNFFKQLDETIALHKRMIEKLEKIKQAYLERMFI